MTLPLYGARVLVVEDNPILAFDVVCLLSSAGAEAIGPAKTLKEACLLAESKHLDCGLLDVGLGDEFVFPAAWRLREQGIGVIFYTGFGDPDKLKREWPDALVLIKPVPAPLLIATVRTACRRVREIA